MKNSLARTLRAALSVALVFLFTACNVSPTMTPTSPSPTLSTLPANAVETWLTLGNKTRLLSHEANQVFTPGSPASGNTITVDANTLYQQFEGAGAAMTDSSAWLIMNILSESARQELMSNLFTRDGSGIGISYLRLPMGASDFALQDYTYDDMPAGQTDQDLEHFSIDYEKTSVIPALKLATGLNPQLGLLGSPWSPPAWMKQNRQFHGSSLLPEFFQAFADYHVKFVQAYAQEGLTINAVTPQNEPMFATEGYPTMYMSPEDQQTFVRDYLGPAFQAAGLDTHIIIFDHNWDLVAYPLSVLSDPAAAEFVDGVAFHCYGGDVSAQSKVHNQFPDIGIWFTECSGGGWATNFGDNINWNIKNLVIGNFRNWGKSVMLWNLALDQNDGPTNGGCGNCRGVVTINQSSGEVTYNEEYYILGHLTKFVDPGAYRAESNSGNGVPNNVAFLNPDGSLVLIVQSDSPVDFNVAWNGQYFSYRLPGGGAVTFKWNANMQPVATATAAPTQTPRPQPTRGSGAAPTVTLGFEQNGTFYSDYQASVNLAADIVHGGTTSLKVYGESGEWHAAGAYPDPRPFDASAYDKFCFWIYDATQHDDGSLADNTVGISLIDAIGQKDEVWSDHTAAGSNLKTVANQWTQMCMNLDAYMLADLTQVDKIQFAMYWPGTYYLDDIQFIGAGAAASGSVPASGVLLDFESATSIYGAQNADASISTIAHNGSGSLLNSSSSGNWHIVGANFPGGSYDLTDYSKICLWVDDTTSGNNGNANNTVGVRLVDSSGLYQEVWSDQPGAGDNPRTARDTWTQMCINLSAYSLVNMSSIQAVELEMYWAGDVYFDDITVVP